FWKQPDLDLPAAEGFGVAALPAASVNVRDGHQIHLALAERVLHRFEHLLSDDGDNQFHVSSLSKQLDRREGARVSFPPIKRTTITLPRTPKRPRGCPHCRTTAPTPGSLPYPWAFPPEQQAER